MQVAGPRINILLNPDRDFTGMLSVEDEGGEIIAGPFPICARAADSIAAENGNPTREPILPFGDPPVGVYRSKGFIPTGGRTAYRADLHGTTGAILLAPVSGDAALADACGRFEILIHGGPPSPDGRLRMTSGHFRILDADLLALATFVRSRNDGLEVHCMEAWTDNRVSVAPVPELASSESPIMMRPHSEERLSAVSRHLVAFGEYSNNDDIDSDDLNDFTKEGYEKFSNNCSGSTAYTAEKYGIDDLSGKNANSQVEYMENNWTPVNARDAQKAANEGEFVVAGKENPVGHGHTAVVVPGEGATKPDGNFYPNVRGGGTGAGASDGAKTAGDVWNKTDRKDVKYYKKEQ